MRYPIDEATLQEFMGHIVAHEKAQRETIKFLSNLIVDAIRSVDEDQEEEDWYVDGNKFLQMQHELKNDHENRIFDDENVRKDRGMKPRPKAPPLPHSVARATQPVDEDAPRYRIGTGNRWNDAATDGKLNEMENGFGEEMSETDLALHFREPLKKSNKKKVDLSKKRPFKGMTEEEIVEWEKAQDNATDLYKIKARVANLARDGGATLTPQGEMLANTFVHVLKALYDFAGKLEDKPTRIALTELIKKQENMPAQLIKAAGVGVRVK